MESRRYDLLIRNVTLFDGTGAAPRVADVAIRGDRIAAVGVDLEEASAAAALDGRRRALAPGFIDVHTHDDFAVVLYPEMPFKVLQGVTTTIAGNCGFGAAPYPSAALFSRAFHPDDDLPEWEGFRGYRQRLETEPPSLNVGFLVGHGTLRDGAMGNEAREPTAGELDRMRHGLREGLEAGALGLSTGLIYEPGRYARPDEIVALARELSETGGLYATHMRNEADGLVDSVRESIEVGEQAGVPVQISHHKALGRSNWGRVRDSLRLIEQAQARGLDVTADQYPYTSGSTILAVFVPKEPTSASAAPRRPGEGQDVVLASAPHHPEWEGKTLAELAEAFGTSAGEAARLVVEEEGVTATVVHHGMDEGDVQTVLKHPSTMIGSDGLPMLKGKPHPRLYGTFPRVLGRYVRELKLLPLAEAIHRMTGFPARKFGLSDRGVVREGAFADLVLFDPEGVADVATYEDPHQPPEGIAHVFVNGVEVAREGRHTGARPGRPIVRA
jgi:N-acyl-D-amino-acid deacylase